MKKSLLLFLVASCIACKPSVSYPDNVNTVAVNPEDTPEQIIAKAVETKPSIRQQIAMDDEFIAFVHFGPNTFTGREWGTGIEDAADFNPTGLDTDQWCRTMKEAGMKKVVLTVKHHDGYVIYQTRYTDHGIMSSPFMNGKGDVLRSLSESCARYGLKLGVYLSPADLWQMEDGNLYGNGSVASLRTIPKQVEGRPFADRRTFQFVVDDYNEYFLSQLFELLTEYGPIHEVWFDGAHPRHKGNQQYNYSAWRELIRTLAPEAVVFGREDIRWVGNEAGDVRDSEWNVIPYIGDNPDTMVNFHDMTDKDLATTETLLSAPKPFFLHYQPSETDTSIRDGWFFRNDDEQKVRSADNVFDIYERACGGNSIFILNLPPTKDGVLGERDVKSLVEVGRRIRETYGTNLFRKNLRKPAEVGEGLVFRTKKPCDVNRVVLCEPVAFSGERIEECAIDAWVDGEWREVATAGNVGHKRIVRFASVNTDRIRVRATKSRADAILSSVSAHHYAEHPVNLSITQDNEGLVSINPDCGDFTWNYTGQNSVQNITLSNRIHYTTDGSDPDSSSPVYSEPFKFENGTVKAISFIGNDCGDLCEQYVGYDRSAWKTDIQPMYTLVDCGKEIEIHFMRFVPNINNYHGDYVSKCDVSVSSDGKKWTKVATEEFGNIQNDPTPRKITLARPCEARYIRLDVLELVGDGDGFQSVDSSIEVL